ncbi:MAG: DUF5606 domain-containing protein [Bacteroidales bacterium]|nr:DUF5606 domain-containing protein [Bacteroidales bacterium]MBR5532469.1 DUF5606 domain-containing protein [Bacteroidales bacterium]
MLKEILSISGKPGLYKLVSQAKGMLVVESLVTGKRIPAYSYDKIISLGDISIYTEEEDRPLAEVFETIKEKELGKAIEISKGASAEEYRKYVESVIPDYDRERVYPNDIKRIVDWYNIIVNAGITEFVEKNSEE